MRTTNRTKLTSKCQVTVPKGVREKLGLKPGDEIEFILEDGMVTVRRVFDPKGLLKYQGYLKHLADRRTDDIIEEMRGR